MKKLYPANLSVYREDQFAEDSCAGTDTPYFKLLHLLQSVPHPVPPAGYELTPADTEELASHIQACYEAEGVTCAELEAYRQRPVYDAALWIAIRDRKTGRIVASGIGELDTRISEGILEWIQVSPAYRRRGWGRIIVYELLWRLTYQADFVTVSGKVNERTAPRALYERCGFGEAVIWHVLKKR